MSQPHDEMKLVQAMQVLQTPRLGPEHIMRKNCSLQNSIVFQQWFPKWAVRNSRGRWSRNGRLGGGEAEMGGWGDRRPS